MIILDVLNTGKEGGEGTIYHTCSSCLTETSKEATAMDWVERQKKVGSQQNSVRRPSYIYTHI